MARPTSDPDPDLKAYVVDAVNVKGRASREVSRELKSMGYSYSHMTVARWARQAKEAPDPATAPASPLAKAIAERQAAAAAQPPIDTSDTLKTLRDLAASMLSQAALEKLSNPKLSATLTRSASDVLNTIARVEKQTTDDRDVLRVSRKEIDDAWNSMLERYLAICERPLLCARCSRELSIEWGEAREKILLTPQES